MPLPGRSRECAKLSARAVKLTIKQRILIYIVTIGALMTFAAAMARAEIIEVSDNHGGRVAVYDARWAAYARQGVSVRIVRPCRSTCTVLVRHIFRAAASA